MIQDLHSHTYHSYCGKDSPEDIIKNAIDSGIDVVGISDHYYGIVLNRPNFVYESHENMVWLHTRALRSYYEHIKCLAEKYKDYIDVRCGIEITCMDLGYTMIPDGVDISYFDYCLIEYIDTKGYVIDDLFAFAKRCACKCTGVAHTDLIKYAVSKGISPKDFFIKMAEEDIFWELNVNYDSIHKYREHEYVKEFFRDENIVNLIKETGVKVSVGFDGHNLEDYDAQRVKEACTRLKELSVEMVK